MKNISRSKAAGHTSIAVRVILAVLIIFVIIIGSLVISNSVAAASVPAASKSYSPVLIHEGDSLWSIAATYHDDSVTIDDYIKELRHINGIENDGALIPGNYITIYTL